MDDTRMKLHIKNIAKIKEADIQIDGITVIAGENNTGKSTVGKVLFCFFDALINLEEKIVQQKRSFLSNTLNSFYSEIFNNFTNKKEGWRAFEKSDDLFDEIFKKYDEGIALTEELMLHIFDSTIGVESELCVSLRNRFQLIAQAISEFMKITRERVIDELISQEYNSVFHNQINSLYSQDESANVDIYIQGQENHIAFFHNSCSDSIVNTTIQNKALLIDDPTILNRLRVPANVQNNEKKHLYNRELTELRLVEFLNNASDAVPGENALESIRQKDMLYEVHQLIRKAVDGNIGRDRGDYTLQERGNSFAIKFSNLSYGLRTFVMMKKLIEGNEIHEKDVLILDEPEIHLHPQWQVLFAQLVAVLQKIFNLTIVVTTHSPYFMEAIDLYTKFYKTNHVTRFYLSEVVDGQSVITEVTNEHEKIYRKMAAPYETLDSIATQL